MLLATAIEDELLRARNVAYTRLLDAYNHAKQQHKLSKSRLVFLILEYMLTILITVSATKS